MKIFFYILLLIFSLTAFSQQKRILPPSGNNLFISDIEFTASSDKLISVGFDQKIVIWDIASKMPIITLNEHRRPIHAVSVNEKGDRFLTAGEDSTIKIWDAKTYKLLESIPFGAPIYHAAYGRDDVYWIASSPTGKVGIYDATTNKLHKNYDVEADFLNQAVLSTNSKLFFTGDNNGQFKAIGVEDGKTYIDHNFETAIKSISFSPDRSLMLLHLQTGKVELMQMPDLKDLGGYPTPVKQIISNKTVVSEIAISNSSEWLISGQEKGHVDIVRLETMIKQAVVTKHPFITKCIFSRNDRYAAVAGTDLNITILDLLNYGDTSSRRVPYKLLRQESDIPKWIQFHPDSTIAFSGYYSNHWDLKTGIFTSLPAFEESYEDFTYQFESIKEKDHELYYDVKSMLFLIKADTLTYRPYNMKLSDNEKYLAYMRDNKIYHFDLVNKSLVGTYKNNKKIVCVDNSGKYVVSGDPKGMNVNGKSVQLPWDLNDADIFENYLVAGTLEDEYWLYDLEKNKLVQRNKVAPGEVATVKFLGTSNKVAASGYTRKLQVVDPFSGKMLYQTIVPNTISDEMTISADNQLIAINGDDRIIRLFKNDSNSNSLNEVYEIYTLKDHGAVAVNQEGYYISSNSAHKNLAFYYNDKVYPGSYFDLEFNRPDLVLKNSPYSDQETIDFYAEIVQSRVKKTGDLYNLDLPFLEFNNKNEFSVRTLEKELRMKCTLPSKLSTEDLAFFNNNVPVHPKIKKKGNEVEITYTLIPGKNKLEICPKKEGNFGLKDYYEITYDVEEKPELYLVCMGVSEYSNKSFNLKYAAKDTKDFYAEISKSQAFGKVNNLLLTNDLVTKEKLEDIKKFLAKAKENDVVIVFIAGHGVLDDQFNYFYATHDMDFQDPAKYGISFYDLEDLLSNVASINKVLFMDTCHSGELEDEEVVKTEEKISDGELTFRGSTSLTYSNAYQQKANYMSALFSDLRTNNGAVILSSSSGVEFSMEGDKWKNGLFTYCLLKGLKENHGDLDNDGSINILELLNYVTNQVYYLSHGQQRPNLRQSNIALDLRIK
ncbi:MAG: caspase family protein [Crocinitomicaceae bacterium]|nr:caspase family protein [Crocinitomicaceae bacterium]